MRTKSKARLIVGHTYELPSGVSSPLFGLKVEGTIMILHVDRHVCRFLHGETVYMVHPVELFRAVPC